ncbi:MAG: hypothetical protein IJ595_00770 [Oscillospiraceae bacterium]|nr:hypothetical protein [Oscillospiraceae bacterium]
MKHLRMFNVLTRPAVVAIHLIRIIANEPDALLLLGIYRQRVIALAEIISRFP